MKINLSSFVYVLIIFATFMLGFLSRGTIRTVLRKFSILKYSPKSKGINSVWKNLEPLEIQEIVKILGRRKATRIFNDSQRKLTFTSQYGEDIFFYELFDFTNEGFFIEIGAYDGLFLSNTYLFEQLGWQGILVEPLPEKFQQCVVNRPNSNVIHAAIGNSGQKTTLITHVIGEYPDTNETLSTHSFVNTTDSHVNRCKQLGAEFEEIIVPSLTFSELAAKCNLLPGAKIDFISIDCEGMDFEVLKSINLEKFRPRIFLIESNDVRIIDHLRNFSYIPTIRIQENTVFAYKIEDIEKITETKYWQALLDKTHTHN